MSTPFTPSTPPSAGDDRNLVKVDPAAASLGFEERLQAFWTKNSKLILLVCAGVLLAIVAKGGVEFMRASKEKSIAAAYAAAATNEQLKAFAAVQDGHALAGAAHLRLADEAYGEGRYTEAVADYEKAAAIFKEGPWAGRSRLGAAMSKFHSGQAAAAEADLQVIANDVTQLKAVRAEATYHLANLAAEAGRTEDVAKFANQVMTIAPASSWSQRALMLRAMSPAAATAPTSATTEPGSTDDAADVTPAVQFKIGN